MGKAVVVQVFLEDLLAEDVACASRGNDEAGLALLGVAPHQVAKRAVVRNLLKPIERLNLID